MKLLCTSHISAADLTRGSEDAVRVRELPSGAIAVLADGVGAAKDGGNAAQRAVDMMIDYYLARPQVWSPRRSLAEFAQQINRLFFQESLLRYGTAELVCTLSVVVLEEGRLYGLNTGDSPIYLWRKDQLTCLSESHVLSEAAMRHVITRALGLTDTVEPYFFETAVEPGDRILLCSDGVSTPLQSVRLKSLMGRAATARSIVAAAREAAEHNPEFNDDASAAVLEVHESGWRAQTQQRSLEVMPALKAGDRVDEFRLIRSLQYDDRVWVADSAEGTRHVLKFPPLDARDDAPRQDLFIKEAWQASRVDSADFIRGHIPTHGALRYYCMEFVDAPTLRDVLRAGPLKVEETVALARFLLRACQYLLKRDLAHGDIKPENILVVRQGALMNFRLLDLGSAAPLFSVTSRAGTPSYLAPERFRGGALSERTEIFAIGVTLYEALAGCYPYGEVERFQTPRFEHLPRPLPRHNPVVPAWLDHLVQRALSADPARRYQNFSELTYDIDHPEEVRPHHTKDAPFLERNPLQFYKSLSALLFAICVALLILLAS